MTTLMTFETSRFGTISFEAEDVVTFTEGLVGLSEFKRFVLIQHGENSPFRWLQSLDDGAVALLVVEPSHYVTEYSPEMPESVSSALELTDETPILVYTICNIPKGNPKGMTMNLAGPIVINAASQNARQVVLEHDAYPVKFNVFAAGGSKAA